MTATAIDLPLLRVLKSLNVPDAQAEAAAEATLPNLSQLATKDDLKVYATKDELRMEISALRAELKAEIAGVRTEIAQTAQRQTTGIATIVLAAAGAVIAAGRLLPPAPSTDAVRAIVEQTLRSQQPRTTPQP